jgi:hypothetical protein
VITAASVAGTFDLLAAGAVSDVGTSGLTAATALFNIGAGNDMGSAANRFNTTVGTLTVNNGGAAGANNVFVQETDALVVNTVRFTGTFDVASAGTLTDVGANGLFGGTANLNVGAANDIGTSTNFLDTTIDTLNVGASPGAKNVFVNETNALTIGLVETDAASGSTQMTVGGNLAVGRISTGTFTITAAGSITDNNPTAGDNTVGVAAAAANFQSSGLGRLVTTGTAIAGTLADGLDLAMGGVLTVNIAGATGGVSGVFFGTAANLIVEASAGQVFFNGKELTGANAILGSANSATAAATSVVFQTGTTTNVLIETAQSFDDADDDTDTVTDTTAAGTKTTTGDMAEVDALQAEVRSLIAELEDSVGLLDRRAAFLLGEARSLLASSEKAEKTASATDAGSKERAAQVKKAKDRAAEAKAKLIAAKKIPRKPVQAAVRTGSPVSRGFDRFNPSRSTLR